MNTIGAVFIVGLGGVFLGMLLLFLSIKVTSLVTNKRHFK